MSARQICNIGLGDEDAGKMAEHFQAWSQGLLEHLQHDSSSPGPATVAGADEHSEG